MEQREQDWKQAGLLQDITRCGPERRPCVLTDLEAGSYGDHDEFKVLQGGIIFSRFRGLCLEDGGIEEPLIDGSFS